jgi:hypothetical protein
MNDIEVEPVSAKQNEGSADESLQLQLTLQLLALVLLAATLVFFFFVHARRAKFDLAVIKPPATALIQTYEQEKPNVDAFLAKLVEYGRTHSDFVPILQKYPFLFTSSPPLPASTAAKAAVSTPPKPAATSPAPKK